MDKMSKLQLQKILEAKRKSSASAPKLTIAETEKIIADREIIAGAVDRFEQLKKEIGDTADSISAQHEIMKKYDQAELIIKSYKPQEGEN